MILIAAKANPFAALESALEWLPLTVAALAVLLLIGIILSLANRYRENDDPAVTDRQMLGVIEELRNQGELTDEEFRSIKGRLSERLSTTDSRSDAAPESAENASRRASLADVAGVRHRSDYATEQPLQSAHSIQSESPSSFENVPGPDADPEQRRQKEEPADTETRDQSMDSDSEAAE